jgi:threonine/homoserine/homoserine lactone efflux protein
MEPPVAEFHLFWTLRAAALGISGGCLVHVCGCAIGLSTLLAASSAAFMA